MFICIHVNDAYDDAADAPAQCDVRPSPSMHDGHAARAASASAATSADAGPAHATNAGADGV